jgi:nicotinamide mononucleotide (NMN) deamidase PncC
MGDKQERHLIDQRACSSPAALSISAGVKACFTAVASLSVSGVAK